MLTPSRFLKTHRWLRAYKHATDWTDETHSKNVDANFAEVFDDTQVKRLDFVVSADRWQSMLDDMTSIYGTFGASSSITTSIDLPNDTTLPSGLPDMSIAPSGPPDTSIVSNIPQDDQSATVLIDTDEDPIFVPADVFVVTACCFRCCCRFCCCCCFCRLSY